MMEDKAPSSFVKIGSLEEVKQESDSLISDDDKVSSHSAKITKMLEQKRMPNSSSTVGINMPEEEETPAEIL